MTAEDLMQRLQALEDERGILRAIRGFAHALDHGVKDWWLDVWTEDAVFEVRDRHDKVTTRVEGREALTRMIESQPGPPNKFVKRLPTATVIDVDGDAASAQSYFTRFDERGEREPFVYAFGRYFDSLVRCPDGRWRIKHRLARVDAEVGR